MWVSQNEASASDTEPPGISGKAGDAFNDGEALASLGYIDCIQYCLEQRGESHPKALLMGLSGETFRICFDRNRPTQGAYVVLHNPLRAICAALGYECQVVYNRDLEAALAALRKDLAAQGHAILHTTADWVVVQADADHPQSLLASMPGGSVDHWPQSRLEQLWIAEPGLLELGLEGYYHFVLSKKEREPDQREAAMGALRRGVRMLLRKSRVDGCAAGLAAYRELLDSLSRKHRDRAQQTLALRKYALWNARALPYLLDARRAAALYLTMLQSHFDDETNEHLRKAAAGYQKVTELLGEVPPVDAAGLAFADERPGVDERKAARSVAASRRVAARRVRRALQAEDEAQLEIRRALEAAEKKDREGV
jgi:hypothetical protein